MIYYIIVYYVILYYVILYYIILYYITNGIAHGLSLTEAQCGADSRGALTCYSFSYGLRTFVFDMFRETNLKMSCLSGEDMTFL